MRLLALPARLGRLGLLCLLPISLCYAELTIFVEAPILSRYRSGLYQDFSGPDLGGLRMQFTLDESYSDSYDHHYLVGTDYFAEFDILRASATGNGASFNSTGAQASVSGWRPSGSPVWQYTVDFWMIATDPVAANAQGSTYFDSFGFPPPDYPSYNRYSFVDDPYFESLGAGFTIVYVNVSQSPEEFIQSLLTIGFKDESQIVSFYTDVSLVRYADGPSLTAYQASYAGFEDNEFSILVAVPEPSTYGIAGFGLLTVAALIRRRRRGEK